MTNLDKHSDVGVFKHEKIDLALCVITGVFVFIICFVTGCFTSGLDVCHCRLHLHLL